MIDVLRRAGAYGQAKKHYPADDPRVIDARRDLVAARLIEHIKSTLADEPPLTNQQVEKLAGFCRAVTTDVQQSTNPC